jgi:hypothetical protein
MMAKRPKSQRTSTIIARRKSRQQIISGLDNRHGEAFVSSHILCFLSLLWITSLFHTGRLEQQLLLLDSQRLRAG